MLRLKSSNTTCGSSHGAIVARVCHQVNRDSEWSMYTYCHVYLQIYSYATEHCKHAFEIIVTLLWYIYTSSIGEGH